MDNFGKRRRKIADPSPDEPFHRRSVSQMRQIPLPMFFSRRRHQAGPMRPIEEPRGADCLNKILQDIKGTLAAARPADDADCALYLHVIDDIDFDCQQPFLAQVLEELISNASAAMSGQMDARIDVTATQYDDRLFMQVADNGPGLPGGLSTWITNWSYDADKGIRHKGSGLDTAAFLIAIAGGQLEVLSTSSLGSRFGFSVPLPSEMAAKHRGASASRSVKD